MMILVYSKQAQAQFCRLMSMAQGAKLGIEQEEISTMMALLKEFRDFAVKGNVVDMAVGVIIGGAFGKIVSSLVSDVLMPPIGRLMGGVDFSNLFFVLGEGQFKTLEEAKAAGAATLNYGIFLNNVINFVIVAFCVFMMIKALNSA